jgi:hypothetical protein
VISVQRHVIRHYNIVDLFFAVKTSVLNLQVCKVLSLRLLTAI